MELAAQLYTVHDYTKNLADFDDIDVYGHIDYIVRYAPSKAENYSYQKYQEMCIRYIPE